MKSDLTEPEDIIYRVRDIITNAIQVARELNNLSVEMNGPHGPLYYVEVYQEETRKNKNRGNNAEIN